MKLVMLGLGITTCAVGATPNVTLGPETEVSNRSKKRSVIG